MNKRIYGFDLLRAILMLFIIIGHLFAHTGIKDTVEFLSFKWDVAWICQSFTTCAVNCFVLLTGFLMVDKSFKAKRIVSLWGRVLLYSLSIFIVLLICNLCEPNFGNIKLSVFPVFNTTYWFFTCYIVLSLFIPFLNIMINYLDRKRLFTLNIINIYVFFMMPIVSFFFKELDGTSGYGIIQFICLYIFGASIKKFDVSLKRWLCVVFLFASSLCIFISKIVLEMIKHRLNLSVGTALLYHNNTVFVLMVAVLMVLLFKSLHIPPKMMKILSVISDSIFSIYLIHENPLLRSHIWNDGLSNYLLKTNDLTFCAICFFIPLLIFITCLLLDLVRKLIVFLIDRSGINTSLKNKYDIFCQKIDNLFPRIDEKNE